MQHVRSRLRAAFFSGVRRLKWRKLNNILHRDIGYLSIALTIIYGISGIAVNHIEDWNPNYAIVTEEFMITMPDEPDIERISTAVGRHLNEKLEIESSFRPAPGQLQLFYGGNTLYINTDNGLVRMERAQKRPVLFDVNFLHLNHAKRLWTYVADLYAIALIVLAITGLFVLPGKKGIKGRGGWLTLIGLLIPVIFLILYRYV